MLNGTSNTPEMSYEFLLKSTQTRTICINDVGWNFGSAISDPYLSFAAALNGLASTLQGLANQVEYLTESFVSIVSQNNKSNSQQLDTCCYLLLVPSISDEPQQKFYSRVLIQWLLLTYLCASISDGPQHKFHITPMVRPL